MSAVTIDPSVEACQALVTQINAGTAYVLAVAATYSEEIIDPLEEVDSLRVDVATDESETLSETLDVENRTSHLIRVWIRSKVDDAENVTINQLKRLVRQIFQRVNNFNSSNGRARVWECDQDLKQNPDKDLLRESGLFVSSILLRVEVEAA